MPSPFATHLTHRWENGKSSPLSHDPITPESPLSIRLRADDGNGQWLVHDLAVTMRSPGQDDDLIRGYLFAEGIIRQAADITAIRYNSSEQAEVVLAPGLIFKKEQHQRYSYTTSSCGLCGKTSLDQLAQIVCHFPVPGQPTISGNSLCQLPQLLSQQQLLFHQTGGIHAAALYNAAGKPLLIQEDVGRHNAFDKLCGRALREQQFPWRDKIVLVSGRLSYELVQKAAMAGTPLLAAIGAPSTLAIELAEETGMTLVGFLRHDRFNIYTYPERVTE
jgi:FdhD protein